MVRRLESAGLGYHVGAKQTYEKIGKKYFFVSTHFLLNKLA